MSGPSYLYRGVIAAPGSSTPHRSGEPDVGTVWAGDAFPGCRNAPVHLLTLDLGAVPAFPEAVRRVGKYHVVYTNCESCSAWMMDGNGGTMYFDIRADGRLAPIEPQGYPLCCEEDGAAARPETAAGIELLPCEPGKPVVAAPVHVGGEPDWLQHETWAACPRCNAAMVFVALVMAWDLPPDASCGDQHLYCFLCPACRVAGMIMQCT